ncbi:MULTISPECIES: hypothetical protein [Paenarthrobacter]|uniref:Uncharacterized protein n=1 Tax=Paenarthrobacter aromaticivorans TaxID=2849150 RepID=A0ABS6I9N7_9MICC|nr:hypothetical protein [Paenarthrobacter sp. MMS21-TAE1-1]MBU8868428.1 hypothetical protein [Paenarthrobacter sp. MMS21-TAE1-1]
MDGENKIMAGASGTYDHRRRAFRHGRVRSAGDGGVNVNQPLSEANRRLPERRHRTTDGQ